MKNIILIGMPGSGKSTAGVLLAKMLKMDFLDTDLVIQAETLMTLQDIINRNGVKSFIELENIIVSKIKADNTVIATGGSVVYGNEAMCNLKNNGICVYLKLSAQEVEKRLCNLDSRGVAMEKDQTIQSLYNERVPLYEKYADITLDTEGQDLSQTILTLSELLNNFKK